MENSWEEELKEYIDDLDCVQGIHTGDSLKNFINYLLSQTRQQTTEEAIEALEDEYDSWPTFLPPMNKSRIMEKIMKALHNKLNAPKT